MTVIDYALALGRIVKASSRIKALLLPSHGDRLTVSVGTEQDRTNFQLSAPYVFLYPADEDVTPERINCAVRMEIGLCDESVTTANGVTVLAAYQTLRALVPMALREIADHLPGITLSGTQIQGYRASYEQDVFPLVKAVVDIEIIAPTPVGVRSVI